MAKQKHHFVPRTYLKAWETHVYDRQTGRWSDSLYRFYGSEIQGSIANKDSTFFIHHMYTIKRDDWCICARCPAISADVISKIQEVIKKRSLHLSIDGNPVQLDQINSYLISRLDDWVFFRDEELSIQGPTAKVINEINDLRCYLIEDAFAERMETNWASNLKRFIAEVNRFPQTTTRPQQRVINLLVLEPILDMCLMMLLRNKRYTELSFIKRVSEVMLYPLFRDLCLPESFLDEFLHHYWLSELYHGLYHENPNGILESLKKELFKKGRVHVFRSQDDSSFITTDTPAFEHLSAIDANSQNGYYFPLTPKYLLAIYRGDTPALNHVVYQNVSKEKCMMYNRIIYNHRKAITVADRKYIGSLLV